MLMKITLPLPTDFGLKIEILALQNYFIELK